MIDFSLANIGLLDNRFLAKSIGLLKPHNPITVEENSSIEHAIQLLQQNKVGCVIVTDRPGKIVGIVTERDVVIKVALAKIDLSRTQVTTIMTKAPHTEFMTTSMAHAVSLMSRGGFRHLPIVDEENYPIGIISVKDLIDFIVGETLRELEKIGT
ncbi:MAG: CBS domain-containing protein [Deltaproteobacteria bacterium]|nr:CBS domain-containing protein [Deltaproteobacteria bacterium]